MLETIYIARHGFRQSFNYFAKTSPTGTKKDPPLTALGIDQAKEVATFFSKTLEVDKRPQLIFSSPYYRCLQTATPTAEALDLSIHVEFGISEYFQRVTPGTGLHPRPPSAKKLQKHFSRIAVGEHETLLYASREGETMSGIHDRAAAFTELLELYIAEKYPNVKTIVLFSHAATVIALGRALCKDRELDIRAGTCSLSRYDWKKTKTTEEGRNVSEADDNVTKSGKSGKWDIGLNGWTGHLESGEQRHWDFEQEIEMDEPGMGEGVKQEHEEEEDENNGEEASTRQPRPKL